MLSTGETVLDLNELTFYWSNGPFISLFLIELTVPENVVSSIILFSRNQL